MILSKRKPTYVRTKEHIYKRFFIDQAIMNECGCGLCDEDLNPIGETIIKESDNLEELCDEFVGISDGKPQMLRFVPYACAQYWNGGVYGAIWADKGLIYVAKMNEKGELELL